MTSENASKHYTLEELSEGVYAAYARPGGAAVSNAGLVDLGDSTVVVDAFLTPAAAEDLRADAQRLTGRIPRRVVNTHYHNDHIWGSQAFLPEADVLSTTETRVLIDTAGKEEYDYYRSVANDRLDKAIAQQAAAETDAQRATFGFWIGVFRGLVQDFPRLCVALPNLVFENRMVLYGSRRRIELVAFSGAHTGSDVVAYLPDDGIVFMSDLLSVGYHSVLTDGNPDRWVQVLGSILDGTAGIEGAGRFVPGHGPTATAADVQRQAGYIQVCQQLARALAAEGKARQADLASTPIPEAFAGLALPRAFYANLAFLLEEYQDRGKGTEPTKPKTASHSWRP